MEVLSNLASFCRHCGNAIGDGVEKCNHCGASLNGAQNHHQKENLPNEPTNKLPEVSPEDLLAQAMKLAEEGAYDDAILVCKRAVGVKGDFVAAYAFLGELYERLGEREKALNAYEKALELDKDYEPAKLGKERLEREPEKPAVPLPKEEGSWVWVGHPLPLLGATALVVSLLFAVRAFIPPVPRKQPIQQQPPITLAPSPHLPSAPQTAPPMPAAVEAALKRGMDALNAQKYDEAIRWFERALQFAPNSNEARSWLLIARAMKEEAQEQRRPSIVAARPEPVPLPILPSPEQQTSQPKRSQTTPQPTRQFSAQIDSSQQQQNPVTPAWMWQSQWGSTSPTMPQSNPMPSFMVQSQPQRPILPNTPQSPIITSPTEKAPSVNPSASSLPNIPPPPLSVEDMERMAAQKVYEGDFVSAVQIYRNIISQGVGIEREGYIRQQLALALQQLRRYEEAAEEYANAIAAYKRQIEHGINVPTAQRGIEACQRGIEICKRAR